ncbi:MAG TPA: NfeD family protein [Candidatus Didemnitutus sp.]|nr:NfeD family protein [Candidatus Didemnitutus sp.]
MNLVFILFVLGVLLLAGEVFVPGAVLGILGGAAMLIGCVISFRVFGATGGAVATLTASACLGLLLWIELVWLPRSRFGKRLVVQSASDGKAQPPIASEAVVGRTAEAETTLAPSGYVLVDGRRYEAYCEAGHAAKGSLLRVTGLDNFRLLVTKS